MKKQQLAVISIVFALGVFIWGFGSFILGGDLEVVVTAPNDNSYIGMIANDKRILSFNEQTNSFRLKNVLGTQNITVFAAGYAPITTKQDIYLRGNNVVTVSLEPLDALSVAKQYITNAEVVEAVYSQNNETLTASVVRDGNAGTAFMEFDRSDGSWKPKEDGVYE